VDPLELEIRRWLSKELSVPLERISGTSTLEDGFGVTGDDAIELFQAYEKTFQVDISALWGEWRAFFGPEGGPLWFPLFVPPFVVAMLLVFVASSKVGHHLSELWEFSIMVALGLLLWFVWARLGYWPLTLLVPEFAQKPFKQITVGDLVAAARRGSWG
jgi:hypothetical protein